jgi:hypothetical protein
MVERIIEAHPSAREASIGRLLARHWRRLGDYYINAREINQAGDRSGLHFRHFRGLGLSFELSSVTTASPAASCAGIWENERIGVGNNTGQNG